MPNTSSSQNVPQSQQQGPSAAGATNLWDRAYETFAKKNPDLDSAFREILSTESASPAGVLTSKNYADKEKELSALKRRLVWLWVKAQVERMESREWKIRLGRKTIKIRKQIEGIIKILSAVKDFGTQAAALDPVHAGLPVAGLYLILSFVTNDKDSRDALFDGLESTSNIVRRYAAIEKVYVWSSQGQAQDALQDSILSVYGRILEFEARALCQCHHNVAFQTFKNMFGGNSWKDVVQKISDADTTCTKLLPTLDAESQSSHSKQLSDILSAQTDQIEKSFQESNKLIESILEEVRAARNEQRYWEEQKDKRNFLSVLRTTDFEFSKNKNPERSPGTCEWLLQHPEYQKWLKQASTPCLWLTADPGCGKSVLSRHLVDDFTEITAGNATICYFFFKASEENENPNNALCALLYQLFEQNEHLLNKYGIPEYQKGGSLANLFEPLWNLLVKACRDPDAGQIICILDALDECAASHKRILVTKFAEFCACNPTSVNFRILMTSRIENALQASFNLGSKSKATFVRLTGEGEKEVAAITKEINLVINEEIERFKEAREQSEIYDDAHNILRQEIDKVDNRTYLWVSLVFPELHENAYCEKSELLQIIKTLPRTVEKAYEGILSRSTNVERARKLLSIVLAAIRPLTLTELKIAFSMDRNGNYSVLDKISEVRRSKPKIALVGPIERAFRESIRQYCGLFIRITESKVYLIHQTAQEFLLESQIINNNNDLAGWKHSFKNADTNLTLARSCIWYLKLPQFAGSGFESRISVSESDSESDSHSDEEANEESDEEGEQYLLPSRAEYISQHHFIEYAATHWVAHFNTSNAREEDEISADATELCSIHAHVKTWSSISYPYFPSRYTGLLLAARCDLVQVLKILLLRGENISQVDGYGHTALHVSTQFNHLRVAKVLIEFNAPINPQDEEGYTPLHEATDENSKEMVDFLLSHNADTEIRSQTGWKALHIAARSGFADIARSLINAGANVNALDSDNLSPRHLATLLRAKPQNPGLDSLNSSELARCVMYDRGIDTRRSRGQSRGGHGWVSEHENGWVRECEIEYLCSGLGLSHSNSLRGASSDILSPDSARASISLHTRISSLFRTSYKMASRSSKGKAPARPTTSPKAEIQIEPSSSSIARQTPQRFQEQEQEQEVTFSEAQLQQITELFHRLQLQSPSPGSPARDPPASSTSALPHLSSTGQR
ncbi:uncharacterized protein PAC_17736 [Phialocephala subalpina]|uniref:Uncharacterized protein n=1 Tax=Phialocephala subalpina TaxID=576137 RepID=A0A1L7XSB3_9HELO|nr:uncharacterized protein PAC_17736 [Phialocephala subalpina]